MTPRSGNIDLAVLEFSGNSWTDCMRDPATGDFRRDAALLTKAPDGAHFCPTAREAQRGVTGTCAVWSSGAYRYGLAMAAPVVRDFSL